MMNTIEAKSKKSRLQAAHSTNLEVNMVTTSESKLFMQSAAAMAGFILFLTLVGWAFQPKTATVPHAPVIATEIQK